MSAFNARLRPKEMFGVPLFTVGCVTLAIPCGAMALLLPLSWLSGVFLALAVVLVLLALIFLVLGAERVFLTVRLCAWREARSVTVETWTER